MMFLWHLCLTRDVTKRTGAIGQRYLGDLTKARFGGFQDSISFLVVLFQMVEQRKRNNSFPETSDCGEVSCKTKEAIQYDHGSF